MVLMIKGHSCWSRPQTCFAFATKQTHTDPNGRSPTELLCYSEEFDLEPPAHDYSVRHLAQCRLSTVPSLPASPLLSRVARHPHGLICFGTDVEAEMSPSSGQATGSVDVMYDCRIMNHVLQYVVFFSRPCLTILIEALIILLNHSYIHLQERTRSLFIWEDQPRLWYLAFGALETLPVRVL